MAATASFALLWAIARAALQSITIDEADIYLVWVARPNPSHWEAASNNHVLNSLLMRLTTGLFGVSAFSARMPALLGAAIYIAAAWALCRYLAPALVVQWPMFAALVFNPFVFDHLVAARGYALALGFLMTAIAIAMYAWPRQWPLTKVCAACSACLALSFAANFAFAVVDAFTMAASRPGPAPHAESRVARPPGGGVCAAGIVGHEVRERPGGAALAQGKTDIRCILAGRVVWRNRARFAVPPESAVGQPDAAAIAELVKPLLIPAYALLGVFACSVAMHWPAFRWLHVLSPKERTGFGWCRSSCSR